MGLGGATGPMDGPRDPGPGKTTVMRPIIRSLRTLLAALTLAALAPACSNNDISPSIDFPEDDGAEATLPVEEVAVIAQTALEALNDGDYDGWSASWSAELRAGIDAAAFAEFRAGALEAAGKFVEILDVSLTEADTDGYVRFTFLCRFERGEWIYALAFPADGTEAVGVFFNRKDG